LAALGGCAHMRGMAKLGDWITPYPHGIYVTPADAWIDPSQPAPRAWSA
jgi:putative mRNA 3-end processing factor